MKIGIPVIMVIAVVFMAYNLKEKPNWKSVLGATVSVITVLYLILRNSYIE